MVDLSCEVCGRRIKKDQNVVKIDVGKRHKGLYPSYMNPYDNGYGRAAVHVDCINVEHEEEFPERTAMVLAEKINESKEGDE